VAGWTPLQLRTLAICFMLSMLDGADVLVVSFVAPVLTKAWGVSDAAFGIVFSSGLAGMTLGALFLAPYADIIGRKAMILASTAVIASGMLSSALCEQLSTLVALRFWTGLGIGSMLASITALASEFAPERSRALSVTLVTAGYPAGATIAGLSASVIIPTYGWPGMFVLIGLGSAIMFPLVAIWLPESVQYFLARQPHGALERANRSLEAQRLPTYAKLPPKELASPKPPIGRLLKADLRRGTVMIWGAFFASFFTVYFLTSWVPRIAVQAGYDLPTAINGSAIFNVGAFLGLVLLGWFSVRMGLERLIATFFLLAAAIMVAFGLFHKPVAFFYIGMLAMGFVIQGGFGGLYAIAAQFYPAAIKTTGVGWAIGVGRFGAIAGPALGGVALQAQIGIFLCFALFAIPMVLSAILTWQSSTGQKRGLTTV